MIQLSLMLSKTQQYPENHRRIKWRFAITYTQTGSPDALHYPGAAIGENFIQQTSVKDAHV